MPRDYPAKDSNNSQDHDRRRRRAGTALTVENFAHRKGVTKAIQSFRKRKDDKRTETAKALRRYKKTMKQEGYEPGRGASRKRDTAGREEEQIEPGATAIAASEQPEQNNQKQPYQKRAKTNPFHKTLKKAEEKKQQHQQAAQDREANEQQREKKLKDRRKRSKNMRARTSKGQPVMKHVIHDILRKLERDKEQEGK